MVVFQDSLNLVHPAYIPCEVVWSIREIKCLQARWKTTTALRGHCSLVPRPSHGSENETKPNEFHSGTGRIK